MAKLSTFVARDLMRPGRAAALIVPFLYQHLGLSLTLIDPHGWHAIAAVPNVLGFELEHGLEVERSKYNSRLTATVARTKAPELGEHGGFCDLFVPIIDRERVAQVLVAGPILRRPTTASELVERWRTLTGKTAHPGDPEFSRYAQATFSTPVFNDAQLQCFSGFLVRTAELIAGHADPDTVRRELVGTAQSLAAVAFAARMWGAAQTMVDPSTARTWSSPYLVDQLAEIGLSRVPEHALIGLLSSRAEPADPIDELVRSDTLQRAAVDLARSLRNVVAGRVGNHGVMFLTTHESSRARARARLGEIAERAAVLARRSGFRVHFGASPGSRGATLVGNYHAALAAAEEALSRGLGLVEATPGRARSVHPIAELRNQLAELDPRRPLELLPRFERYLEVVGMQTGYQVEPVRLHLEIGFERLLAPFVRRGLVDPHSLDEFAERRDRAAQAARTVNELFVAYRRAVLDLQGAIGHPAQARRDNDLERALAYIHDHLAEPFRRSDVARAGGFAPDYFSRLFKRRQGVTFETYVQRLRAERAKQLLTRSDLNVDAVGRLCGFGSGPYFHRVFRRSMGATPAAYRRDAAAQLPRRRSAPRTG